MDISKIALRYDVFKKSVIRVQSKKNRNTFSSELYVKDKKDYTDKEKQVTVFNEKVGILNASN